MPRIKPESSRILAGFVIAKPQWELNIINFFYPNSALLEALHHPHQPQVRSQTFKLVCLFVLNHIMWKFPGWGSNPRHSSDLRQSSDNTRFLTLWAMKELLNSIKWMRKSIYSVPGVAYCFPLIDRYYISHFTMRKQPAEGKVTCPNLHTRKWRNPNLKPSLHAINVHILFIFIYSTNIYWALITARP